MILAGPLGRVSLLFIFIRFGGQPGRTHCGSKSFERAFGNPGANLKQAPQGNPKRLI